jgi:hypothetical protein
MNLARPWAPTQKSQVNDPREPRVVDHYFGPIKTGTRLPWPSPRSGEQEPKLIKWSGNGPHFERAIGVRLLAAVTRHTVFPKSWAISQPRAPSTARPTGRPRSATPAFNCAPILPAAHTKAHCADWRWNGSSCRPARPSVIAPRPITTGRKQGCRAPGLDPERSIQRFPRRLTPECGRWVVFRCVACPVSPVASRPRRALRPATQTQVWLGSLAIQGSLTN